MGFARSEALGQASSYPRGSVAPLHPSVPLNQIVPSRLSPWFDIPDGTWNHGEGFSSASGGGDVGGVIGPLTSFPDRNDSISTPDAAQRWRDPNQTQYAATVRMSTGYFWPEAEPNPHNEAGYSLWAPKVVVDAGSINRPIVLVVGLHATQPGLVAPGYTAPWPYIAGADPLGLIPPDFPANPASIIDGELNNTNYYLAIGYAMRPTGPRPYHATLQRAVEFVHFVKDLFQNLPTPRTVTAVIAVGASHGTGIAMLAPTLYPDVFHAGVGFAHPPDFTQAMPMQEFHQWIASHFGYPGQGAASIYDVLGTRFFGKHAQAFGEGLSIPARFRAQQLVPASYLQRPLYLLIGDEDPTDSGEDWLEVLGANSNAPIGTIQVPNAHASVKFYYSLSDKQCHERFDPNGAGFSGSYFTPDQDPNQLGVQPNTTTTPALIFMIPKALDAATQTAQPVSQPFGGLVSLNPFSGIFSAHRPVTWPATGSDPNLLKDWSAVSNPALRWPRLGAGTRLGQGEGLRISTPPDGIPSVFVGSADGVVTRYVVGAGDELVQAAQSEDLGYGAWALDVGDVGGSIKVAVAVDGRLWLLNPNDLSTHSSVALSGTELFRPLRLQIADLDGSDGGEILFSTFGGALAAYSASLTPLATLSEPGIVDFVAAPQLASQFTGLGLGSLPCPIYIASIRRHIFCVELAGGMPSGPRLLAASHGETGTVQDIEVVNWGGGTRIMATYASGEDSGDPYMNRVFDPLYLDRVGNLGEPAPGIPPEEQVPIPLGGIAFEPVLIGGSRAFVIQDGDELRVLGSGGLLLGKKRLGTFGPSRGAIAVESGELAGSASSSEVVISTNTGRVVWFRMSELTAAGDSLATLAPFQLVPGTSTGFERSNRALGATWAMTFAEAKLQVVDQAGMHYAVDPATGATEWKRDFGGAGPHRSLVHVGAIASALSPCSPEMIGGETRWNTARYSETGSPLAPSVPYYTQIRGGYLLGSNGADATIVAGETRFFWWASDRGSSSFPYAHDIVLGGRISSQVLETVWDSAQQGWDNRLRLRNNMSDPGRSEHGDLQSLRIADVRGNGQKDLILGTVGGSVIVVDGSNSPTPNLLGESDDFGWGGTALALGSLDENPQMDPQAEIVFGTLYSPQRMGGVLTNDLQASLKILRWNGGSVSPELSVVGSQSFASSDQNFPIVGICGVAIADVTGSPRNEIIQCTSDGYLLVLKVGGGPANYSFEVLYKRGFPGALGAHNAIHVGDYAINGQLTSGSDNKMEIYVAGSFGLQRFDVN